MEESKESAVQKRRMEGRKRFITNFIYFIILGGIFLFVMKRFVPMFFPFILGLAVAAVLSPLIGKLCEKTGGKRALVSIVVLLVFYGPCFPQAMSLPLFRTWPESCLSFMWR